MNRNGKFAKMALRAFVVACMASIVTACGGPSFKIEGNIDGAEEQPVVMQRADITGTWIDVDSTRTDAKGDFSLKIPAPENPDLYRLCLDGKYLYLPVDSIETLKLTASAANFGQSFTLTGSDQAVMMSRFQQKLHSMPLQNPDSLKAFKRWVLSEIILASQGIPTITAYYAMTCRLADGQLFDVSNPDDAMAFSAVATAFQQYRPDDPRSKTLEKMALQAQRKLHSAKGRETVLNAHQTAMIDIILKDVEGKTRKLSELTSNHKPTLLIFSVMGHENSPEVNRRIAEIYNRKKDAINFYMVCLDRNIATWREQVRSIPWLCVIDPDGEQSTVARTYNVTEIPAFFIYNANGELVDRAGNIEQLNKKLP